MKCLICNCGLRISSPSTTRPPRHQTIDAWPVRTVVVGRWVCMYMLPDHNVSLHSNLLHYSGMPPVQGQPSQRNGLTVCIIEWELKIVHMKCTYCMYIWLAPAGPLLGICSTVPASCDGHKSRLDGTRGKPPGSDNDMLYRLGNYWRAGNTGKVVRQIIIALEINFFTSFRPAFSTMHAKYVSL